MKKGRKWIAFYSSNECQSYTETHSETIVIIYIRYIHTHVVSCFVQTSQFHIYILYSISTIDTRRHSVAQSYCLLLNSYFILQNHIFWSYCFGAVYRKRGQVFLTTSAYRLATHCQDEPNIFPHKVKETRLDSKRKVTCLVMKIKINCTSKYKTKYSLKDWKLVWQIANLSLNMFVL